MTLPCAVVLYTRHGCGLCDDAAIELRALSQRFGFSLEERDIAGEPALRKSYNDVIPVVIADGREVVRAPFAADDLVELLTLASNSP